MYSDVYTMETNVSVMSKKGAVDFYTTNELNRSV